LETVVAERARESWRYSRLGERLPDQCLDCGATMVGPFCASCGQKNEPEHRSLWQLVKDAVGPAVLLEWKLWRTLWTLLRHPGALSEAYAEGKRSRYIRPLRLYLWVSVLFFSAMALRPVKVLTVHVGPKDRISIPFAPQLEKRLQEKLERFREPPAASSPSGERERQTAQEAQAAASERLKLEFVSRLPKALFLLLPVFALLLKLLWRQRPYVEHLVFALHAHTVLFLGLDVALTGWVPLRWVGWLGPVVWFFPAVHRFYRNGWAVTVLKTLVLGFLDLTISVFVVLVTMLVALLGA